MAQFIEEKIKKDKCAPDAIVGYMKTHNYFNREGFESITTPTVYYAIRHQIINVKLENTRRMKYKSEYNYHKGDLPVNDTIRMYKKWKIKMYKSVHNYPQSTFFLLYYLHEWR